MRNKVLVVSSDPKIDWQATLFDRATLRMYFAISYEQGFQLHLEEKVDIIIVDLGEPGEGADIFCRRVRFEAQRHQPAIIVLTPASREAEARAAALSPSAVIRKPFRPDTLLEAVAELLAIPTRRGYRITVATEVSGTDASGVFLGSTQNISMYGMLLETSRQLETGVTVSCSLTLPGGRRIVASGEVVRTVSAPGSRCMYYGVRFLDLDPAVREALDMFVGESVVFS